MTVEKGPDVVKWYTRARKFPQLIGRTPDGARIIGGPYTITQAVGAGLILVVGLNTMSLWARGGLIGNAVLLGLATWGTVWGLGRIPVGSRNPLSVGTGAVRAVGAPRTGRMAGRPVRIRPPHRVQHRIAFALDIPELDAVATTASTVVEAPAPTAPPAGPCPSPVLEPAPARESADTTARKPALTGVQALLAGQATRPNEEPSR